MKIAEYIVMGIGVYVGCTLAGFIAEMLRDTAFTERTSAKIRAALKAQPHGSDEKDVETVTIGFHM